MGRCIAEREASLPSKKKTFKNLKGRELFGRQQGGQARPWRRVKDYPEKSVSAPAAEGKRSLSDRQKKAQARLKRGGRVSNRGPPLIRKRKRSRREGGLPTPGSEQRRISYPFTKDKR